MRHEARMTGISWRDSKGHCKTVKAQKVRMGHFLNLVQQEGTFKRLKFWTGLTLLWIVIITGWMGVTGWSFYGHKAHFWTRLFSVLFAG